MENQPNILNSLSRLDEICSAGYAIALHISFTAPRFLFQTYNKEWMQVYSDKGYVLKDPTVLWGFSNTGLVKWHDLEDIDNAGILALAKGYGLNFGFTYSIDHGASKSITSFARSDRDFTEAETAEILKIVENLHSGTAKIDSFSPVELGQLKKLSVEFTHSAD